MPCVPKLLSQEELEEALEPLSAAAEERVLGHIIEMEEHSWFLVALGVQRIEMNQEHAERWRQRAFDANHEAAGWELLTWTLTAAGVARAEVAESARDAYKQDLVRASECAHFGRARGEPTTGEGGDALADVARLRERVAMLEAERNQARAGGDVLGKMLGQERARVKELTAALESALVQWSGDRSLCTRCRTAQPQVPSPRVPHKHAKGCPLAASPQNTQAQSPNMREAATVLEAVVKEVADAAELEAEAEEERSGDEESPVAARERGIVEGAREVLKRYRAALASQPPPAPAHVGRFTAGDEGPRPDPDWHWCKGECGDLTFDAPGGHEAWHREHTGWGGLPATTAPNTSPTRSPGLLEAVGPLVQWARAVCATFPPDYLGTPHDLRTDLLKPALTLDFARRFVAAFDAAQGSSVLPAHAVVAELTSLLSGTITSEAGPGDVLGRVRVLMDVHEDLRRVLEVTRTGNHVGDTVTAIGEETLQSVRALHTDAAKYHAAVERLNDRAGQAKAAHDAWGSDPEGAVARWVLYGEGGAPAPRETLDKGWVREVLRESRDRHLKAAQERAGSLEMDHRAMADACMQIATRLGLSIDTPPSGPGGGESPSRDDVLNAFSVEADSAGALERYQREHPTLAQDLAELARDLSQPLVEQEGPLPAEDEALINKAWMQHAAIKPTSRARIAPTPTPKVPPMARVSRAHGGHMGPKAVHDAIAYAPPPMQRDASRALYSLAADYTNLRTTCAAESLARDVSLPEPSTPEVMWEGDGLRMLSNGTVEFEDEPGQWRAPHEWLRVPVEHLTAIARALAEAKRETAHAQGLIDVASHATVKAVRRATELGAEDMRERMARVAENVGLKNLASVIRAAPLLGKAVRRG